MDEDGADAARAYLDDDLDEMAVHDVAAPLPQATQTYGAAHEDDEEMAEVDEVVRRNGGHQEEEEEEAVQAEGQGSSDAAGDGEG